MGVPSLDPVHLDDIRIDGNGLQINFTQAAMHGLSNSVLTHLNYAWAQQQRAYAFEVSVSSRILKTLGIKGLNQMGVPSLDPVHLDDIRIDGNGLQLNFTQAAMHGLSNSMLTHLK
ncbi:hypothetical protein NE865_06628 [Phthorimaea operculella]|nr:hypothetical protein NE865_06628 [Phthorimaea operculella]